MIKLKPIIFGVLTEITLFLLLLCAMSFLAGSLGNVTGEGYGLAMEMFSALAVLVGAFVAARCAWEKGAIYGTAAAAIWILLRVILTLAMGGVISPSALAIKAVILLALGFTGGAMGIGKRQKRMI